MDDKKYKEIRKVCYHCGVVQRYMGDDSNCYTDNTDTCPVCGEEWADVSNDEAIQEEIRILRKNRGGTLCQWAESKIGHPIDEKIVKKRDKYMTKQMKEYASSDYFRKKIRQEAREEEAERHRKEMADPNRPKTYHPVPSRPVVECPYCHSTNTTKISQLSRMTSIGFWGPFSKKIGKQWHCNQCGTDF